MKGHTVGKSKIKFEGTGPGRQTHDGCSVDFYLKLPPMGEPELIASNVPSNCTILELGSGVGRVTHPLVEMGFVVTAVDNSADMLAHIHGATAICADIETLKLEQKFDVVLLMSHMINIPDHATRQAVLQSCQRHLKADGLVLVQCHNRAVWQKLSVGHLGTSDGTETFLDQLELDDNLVSATIRWRIDSDEWTQSFETELLDEAQLRSTVEEAGLRFVKWLNEAETWCLLM